MFCNSRGQRSNAQPTYTRWRHGCHLCHRMVGTAVVAPHSSYGSQLKIQFRKLHLAVSYPFLLPSSRPFEARCAACMRRCARHGTRHRQAQATHQACAERGCEGKRGCPMRVCARMNDKRWTWLGTLANRFLFLWYCVPLASLRGDCVPPYARQHGDSERGCNDPPTPLRARLDHLHGPVRAGLLGLRDTTSNRASSSESSRYNTR